MAVLGSGTGAQTTSVSFDGPGLSLSEVETLIETMMDWDKSVGATMTKIDQAITAAGQAACMWEGRDWWWLHDTGNFDTVDGTASYALRTVNSNDMEDLWAVEAVFYDDDHRLTPMTWDEYRETKVIEYAAAAEGIPTQYAVTGEAPSIYPWPVPGAAYTLYVNYIKRHSKITNAGSTDADLIVPAEFQYQVYVDGAAWLLRHETIDPADLAGSPHFKSAMERMAKAAPQHYDLEDQTGNFRDAKGGDWPQDRRVITDSDGMVLFQNDVSI